MKVVCNDPFKAFQLGSLKTGIHQCRLRCMLSDEVR